MFPVLRWIMFYVPLCQRNKTEWEIMVIIQSYAAEP